MQVAFVTYDKFPKLYEDDQLLQHYLMERGMDVIPVCWDNEAVNWQQFDVIVLRSMWDYFERPVEFDRWLDKLAALRCNVLNPLPVVKWNQNKTYFDDFSEKGILLPAYVICTEAETRSLKQILQEKDWTKAVVKPAISGGAYNTWTTDTATAGEDEVRFRELLQQGSMIVQTFVEEVLTQGEMSLIFFNKKFSHAICKKAKHGDFRVQLQFGGTNTPILPDVHILKQAEDLLNSIPEPLLYARVDGVVNKEDKFLLMELELIEPVLFLSTHEKSCEHFYTALTEILNSKNS